MLKPQYNKLPYLNIGCGNRFHPQWNNIDIVSNSADVVEYDITNGIPYDKNTFEVVYHSHVIEHIPYNQVQSFIEDCYRVLKPGGIIRIALPDLENITRLYLSSLENAIQHPSPENHSKYHWMKLELLDQMVRNQSGGMMKEYLAEESIDQTFIRSRIGFEAERIFSQQQGNSSSLSQKIGKFKQLSFTSKWRWIKMIFLDKIYTRIFLFGNARKAYQIGSFRIGGEVHQWMYDRYSIKILLEACHFKNVTIQTAFSSSIPNWEQYELDGKDSVVFKPDSLFVEAIK